MLNSIRASYVTLLKLQAGLTLLIATVLTPSLMRIFGIPQVQWPIFRLMVIAMSIQVFLLFTMLVLLYLDLRGSVVIVCSTFLVTNFGFTILTILGGYQFYGYGFLGASIISVVVSPALLVNRFRNLDYLTFMRQPIQG